MKRFSKEISLPKLHFEQDKISVTAEADSTNQITSEEDVELTVEETPSLDTMTATMSEHSDVSYTECSTSLLQESNTSIPEDDRNMFLLVKPTNTEEVSKNEGQKKYHSKFSQVHSTALKLSPTKETESSVKSDAPNVECITSGSTFRGRGDTLHGNLCNTSSRIPVSREHLFQILHLPITEIDSKDFFTQSSIKEIPPFNNRRKAENLSYTEVSSTSRKLSDKCQSSNATHNTAKKFTVRDSEIEPALPERKSPNIRKEVNVDLEMFPTAITTEKIPKEEVYVIEKDNNEVSVNVDRSRSRPMDEIYPNINRVLSSLDKLCVVRKTSRCAYSTEIRKRSIRHHINDKEGNLLFTAVEKVSSIDVGCLVDNYIIKVVISDMNNTEVMHMYRSVVSMREMMEVWAPPETHLVGQIRESWSIFSKNFYILDSNGQVVFYIEGKVTTCRGDFNTNFNVTSPDRKMQLGRISTNHPDKMEIEGDAPSYDHFAVTFPSAIDKTHKCLLLGVCFLIDILNFYCWGI